MSNKKQIEMAREALEAFSLEVIELAKSKGIEHVALHCGQHVGDKGMSAVSVFSGDPLALLYFTKNSLPRLLKEIPPEEMKEIGITPWVEKTSSVMPTQGGVQ